MKRIAMLLACVLCVLSASACQRRELCSETFFMMDTVITVTLYEADAAVSDAVFGECRKILANADARWNRHIQGAVNDVTAINSGADRIAVESQETLALLQKALAVSKATEGAFDITVAPLVDLWKLCGEKDRLPTDEELRDALALVGFDKVMLTESVLIKSEPCAQIDLGGIGKGAAIGELMAYLRGCGISGGLVSFGSNVAVFGEKPSGNPFRIALQDPFDKNGRVGTLTLYDGEVLSVSGDYERYVTVGGTRYHHIIDPKTGYPANSGLASVAVIAVDGAVADALSTALFVMGEEQARAFYALGAYAFEAVFVASDGTVTYTDGLIGRFAAA